MAGIAAYNEPLTTLQLNLSCNDLAKLDLTSKSDPSKPSCPPSISQPHKTPSSGDHLSRLWRECIRRGKDESLLVWEGIFDSVADGKDWTSTECQPRAILHHDQSLLLLWAPPTPEICCVRFLRRQEDIISPSRARYDMDGASSDLKNHDFIGEVTTTVGSLVGEHRGCLTEVSKKA